MDAKKQVELRYLDVVRRGIDDFPGGNITDTECPDFLIQFLDRTVGVEITRIFNPGKPKSPPQQSQDTERDLIAERAQAIATDQSLAPVMVDIYLIRVNPSGNAIVIPSPNNLLISSRPTCQRSVMIG